MRKGKSVFFLYTEIILIYSFGFDKYFVSLRQISRFMEYKETKVNGVYIIEPKVYADQRGYFMEAFKQSEFNEHAGRVDFIQDNESKSSRGVLRGLHYQKGSLS